MTRHLTLKDFETADRTAYSIEVNGGVAELALEEVRPIARSPRDGGGFVLTFRGPRDSFLPQATYRMTGGGLEADIFVVPVAEDDAGYLYEAVFN